MSGAMMYHDIDHTAILKRTMQSARKGRSLIEYGIPTFVKTD